MDHHNHHEMNRKCGSNNKKRNCIRISPSPNTTTNESKKYIDQQTNKKVRLQKNDTQNKDACCSRSGFYKSDNNDDDDIDEDNHKDVGPDLESDDDNHYFEIFGPGQKPGNYREDMDEVTSDISSSSNGSSGSCTLPVPRVIRIRKMKNDPDENGYFLFLQRDTRLAILAMSYMLFQQAAVNAFLVYFMIIKNNKGDV